MTNRHSCSNAFLIDTSISTINPYHYSFFYQFSVSLELCSCQNSSDQPRQTI